MNNIIYETLYILYKSTSFVDKIWIQTQKRISNEIIMKLVIETTNNSKSTN